MLILSETTMGEGVNVVWQRHNRVDIEEGPNDEGTIYGTLAFLIS